MTRPPPRTTSTVPPSPTPIKHRPHEVLLKLKEQCLYIGFADGMRFSLPAEFLRVFSPAPEPQGIGAKTGKRIVASKRAVTMTGAEAINSDALRLIFDDGHTTGIYSWDYLHELGANQERLWSEYLGALAARGLSRDS